MKTIFLPYSDVIEIRQVNRHDDRIAGANEITKIIFYLFGMINIEEVFRPILAELNIDSKVFFEVFWKHVQKNSIYS